MSASPLRPSHRIAHYPASLIDVWSSRKGHRYTLRPVLPQDHRLLGDMIERLTAASRHERFHGGVNCLSDQALEYMTCIDYRRELAMVVTTEMQGSETLIADARYVIDDHRQDCAEFALMVDDQWRRRGLGLRALRCLCAAAQRSGVNWLYGSVRTTNAPMLALMRRCRFFCAPDPEDECLVQVEVRLDAPAGDRRARHWSNPSRLKRWIASLRGNGYR